MWGQYGGDCLLIDYKMLCLDGLEVMKCVCVDQDFMFGIMIIGYYMDWFLNWVILVGFSDVLEKLVMFNFLIEKIIVVFN